MNAEADEHTDGGLNQLASGGRIDDSDDNDQVDEQQKFTTFTCACV